MLCANCHTIVDRDETTHTSEILHSWKERDQESPKLQKWAEKGIFSLRIVSKVQENLPIQPRLFSGERTLFVGRIAEIAEISSLITNGVRLITLVGEGGVGKTALTVKVIRQVENLFDIIIPVNLDTGMKYEDFLLDLGKFIDSALLRSLDQVNLENLIREIFGSVGQVLLWVDNYENIADFIDTTANIDLLNIHAFLETLPQNTTVILNSRNRLNLEAETIVKINGLSQEDGLILFIEMAKRHLSHQLSPELQSNIRKICELVDGHPLAIKLSAGAYKGGGVSRIGQMLDELYFTIKNRREPTERFRSINACFDYSYGRLSSKLKTALWQLTLFKSYFMSDSAKGVFGIEESVLVELFERTFLQRFPIQVKGGSEMFVYDFHPVIRNYLISKSSKNNSFSPYQLDRYIRYNSKLIRNIYENFSKDVAKYSRLVDLLTGRSVNDLSESISAISDVREKSVISNLLGSLLLQTGHKTRALAFHELCLDIDSRNKELDRMANDLDNIGACISESAYSEQALSYRLQAANSFENSKTIQKSSQGIRRNRADIRSNRR